MIMIEMVAYATPNSVEDTPWRCMLCEKLTHHSDEDIEKHLIAAHNIAASRIKRHLDRTIFIEASV